MAELNVRRGQSLWSIAEALAKGANAAASDADIKKLSNAIATANGLDPEARLAQGRRLVIPDAALQGRAAEALERLRAPTTGRNRGVSARIDATAKPLLDFKVVLNVTTTVAKGVVTLPDVAGVPLKGEVRAFQGTESYVGEHAQLTTRATFGKLTASQFSVVHKDLGGRSAVRFNADREYQLLDFLPPAIQALVDRDLEIPQSVTLKGTKKIAAEEFYFPRDSDHQIGLTSNCHAAAYEALRSYQGENVAGVAVFYGEMIKMDGMCSDRANFDVLHDVKADKASELLSLGLKPGDLVQFHQDNGWMRASTNLLHSAVYVGGGLFFEKPNTEGPERSDPANYVSQDETPYRLATLDNMIKPMSDAVSGRFRIEVLRAKAPLADPLQAFGSSYQKDFEENAKRQGRALGVDLVTEYEQGMAGNIRGEGASALVRVSLTIGSDGVARVG